MKLKDIRISQANREIVRAQVDRLKESIQKNGYFKGIPIIVDKDGWIIDGQHRYVACKELKIEPTIIVDGSFDIVPIINSMQLKWGIKDYVRYYSAKGYEHYIALEQLCKAKSISPSTAYALITGKVVERPSVGRIVKHGATQQSPIKMGIFKFPDLSEKGLAKIERRIDLVFELIARLQLPKTNRLIVAISRLALDKNFSFPMMYTKLDYQMSKVHRCSTIQDYVNLLSGIYNHKNSKKVAV